MHHHLETHIWEPQLYLNMPSTIELVNTFGSWEVLYYISVDYSSFHLLKLDRVIPDTD